MAGNGGGGGGGGRVDGPASDSDMEDEAPVLDEGGSGILGPACQPRNQTEKKLLMITNCKEIILRELEFFNRTIYSQAKER